MYIEITGTDNPVISKFEQERDIYVGDFYSTPIKIKWTRTTNSYVTVSYENSRHMKFGPLYADSTENDGTSIFNITNPRILIPGDLHISIFINTSNEDGKTIKRYAVGVVSTTIKKAVHEGGNIVIVDDEDTSDVIMDMRDSLEKITNLVNAIDANLKEMAKEDGHAQIAGSLDVGGTLSVRDDPVICKNEFDAYKESTSNKITEVDTNLSNQISILKQNTESLFSTGIKASAGSNINSVGTPSVSYSNGTFTFDYLKGERGSVGPAGNPGERGPKGDNGANGKDGKDGNSPYIGDNGNWYVGNNDTGVPAKGGVGEAGVTQVIKVAEGNEIGIPGTPSVNISTQGNVNTFTFNHLKGDKGEKGDPGDAGKQTGVLRRVFDFDFAEKGLDSIEYYSNSAWEEDLLGYVPDDGDNVMAIDVKSHIGTFQIVGPVYLTSGNEGYGMKLKSYTSIKGDKGDASTVPGPKGDPGCSFSLSGTTLTITWNT